MVLYEGEWKVIQYFCNMRHNSATLNGLGNIMKVTNHIGLWDIELAWYSQRPTCQFCFYVLEQRISESVVFGLLNLTWSSRFFCNLNKISWIIWFYCTVINYSFTFYTANVFGCFRGATVQFKLKCRFQNQIMLHIHLCDLQCTTCHCTNSSNTANNTEYLPQLQMIWSRDIHVAILYIIKLLTCSSMTWIPRWRIFIINFHVKCVIKGNWNEDKKKNYPGKKGRIEKNLFFYVLEFSED